MANLNKVVYLSEAQKETLFSSGSVTVDGNTVEYNQNDLYLTPQSAVQAMITASGILKGNGVGGIIAASKGVDYEAPVKYGTISMSASWSGSGPYTKTVTVTGATITANSKVDLQPDATAITQLIEDGVNGLYIVNNNGTLTAYAVGAAPTAALTLQCTVTEVTS